MPAVDLKDNFALTSSNYIKELFEPILNPIGITYFNYVKIYNTDCSRELLTNNPEWINHFYDNELYNSLGTVDVEHLMPKGYFLWSEMDTKDEIYKQGREFFNIDNGITFVIKRKETTLLYIFAANRDNHAINNFYASNIDLLQRFVHFFNAEAQQLIKEAEKNRIYLPNAQMIDPKRVNNITLSESIREEFLKKTAVSRYYLLNENDDLYLTKKQADFAALYIKGYSAKEIARKMEVSPRTIEGHLLDIKTKIQESIGYSISKEQLLNILRNANIK